jgi:siroheme synthase
VVTDLAGAAEAVAREGVRPPAIIVVGEVVQHRWTGR